MMYDSQDFWEQRMAGDGDVDWLCQAGTILGLAEVTAACEQPRCTAMVVGSGTSSLPEGLYDRGVKEVVVLDANSTTMETVRSRNAGGGRKGLRCVHADVTTPNLNLFTTGSNRQPATQGTGKNMFDLVIDKGTLDCILSGKDGRRKACAALANLHGCLKTPGTLILISHSGPQDRLELLQTEYWHNIQVKQVKQLPWHDLQNVEVDPQENVEDWQGNPHAPFEPGNVFIYILLK